MAEKMYFGVLGNIQEIPAPKSGMGFDSNSDTEVTELVSGGRSVYRAPTTYKTLNMTWGSKAAAMKHLIDMFNGLCGPGPFYITDPTIDQRNVLPARWSNCWQLAHQAGGWAKPLVTLEAFPFGSPVYNKNNTNRVAKFTQASTGNTPVEGVVRTRVIRIPGKSYYFTLDGTFTGGAGVRLRAFNSTTASWEVMMTVTTGMANTLVVGFTEPEYTMLELDLYLPLASTMTLKGMSLGTVDLSVIPDIWMPVGQGVGPVQFGDSTGGELVSSVIDRIGLSLDFIEVESLEG